MAQEGNPFYVSPPDITPGLMALTSAFKSRGERQLAETKERKKMELGKEGARLLDSGTPDEIAAFMVKNPEAGKNLSGAIKFKSEDTKRRLLDTVRGIYTGKLDPLTAATDHAESLLEEDADPSDTMELAQIAAQDPEMGKEEAGRIWAGLDPDGFIKAKKALGETVDETKERVAQSKLGKSLADQAQYEPGSKQWEMFQNEIEAGDKEGLTPDELDYFADIYIKTGKRPFQGRGTTVQKQNLAVKRRAAAKERANFRTGIDTFFNRKDTEALTNSIKAQEKSKGSMGSFVRNLSEQVDRVKSLSGKLNQFDTKLINMPINALKRKVEGDPELAKYGLYIGEITSEIGKLSSGATGSVAELSQGAREHWENVIDPNLSLKAMAELLEEVKHAGNLRLKSVDDELKYTKKRRRELGKSPGSLKEKIDVPVSDMSTEDILKELGGL